ncbi:hypothetical protein HK104_004860, partial [Borealophlyctis nickersoniae]
MSSQQEPDNLPLRGEFERAGALYNKLETSDLPSSDTAYQADANGAIKSLERAAYLVRSLGVFSSNEILEDINTTDLRYLLTHAYLGELHLKRVTAPTDRLSVLHTAQHHFDQFLSTCEQHEIFSKEDKKYLEAQLAGGIKDLDKRREEKIARYKREKATKERLKDLHAQISHLTTTSTASETIDEELDRDIILTTIDLFIQKTIESLRMIKDEKEMLEKMQEMLKAQQHKQGGEDRDASTTVEAKHVRKTWDPRGPILDASGKPLKPFVLLNQREALRNQVFRPGHNLPTMTIEQYLDNQIAQGNFLQGGGERPEKPQVDDTDEAAVDAETVKAREWDEFRDANPRGWGNRMNKG